MILHMRCMMHATCYMPFPPESSNHNELMNAQAGLSMPLTVRERPLIGNKSQHNPHTSHIL